MILSKNRITKAYAQAGLRLCCSQTPEDRFSRDEGQIIYNYYMTVCCTVKTITLRCCGRSDALLHKGFDLVVYFYMLNGIKVCAGNDTSVNYNFLWHYEKINVESSITNRK